MKKKIMLLMLSALLLSGCVKQTTTVTIKDDSSAVIEKALTGISTDELSKTTEKKFIDSLRKNQNLSALYKTKTSGDSLSPETGVVGRIKVKDITSVDVLGNETFFTPKNKKNVNCSKTKIGTSCVVDFTALIKSPELDKVLADNGLKYEDLEAYELVFVLPVQPESNNAKYFDNDKFIYIWEIPAGVSTPVQMKFTLK